MLVEHTFVTPLGESEALSLVVRCLSDLGFRITPTGSASLEAVRGRVRPNSLFLAELPQTVQVVYDRGRVNLAASITPRGGKDNPDHTALLMSLATSLERCLTAGLPVEQVVLNVRAREVKSGWATVGRVLLIVLLVLVLIVVVSIIVAAATSHR
jgi:hypothetical protein